MSILRAATTVVFLRGTYKRGILTGRQDGHMEQENRDDVQRTRGDSRTPPERMGSAAGTYVFKIMDSQSDRHIVQIFNKNEKTVYATILDDSQISPQSD